MKTIFLLLLKVILIPVFMILVLIASCLTCEAFNTDSLTAIPITLVWCLFFSCLWIVFSDLIDDMLWE